MRPARSILFVAALAALALVAGVLSPFANRNVVAQGLSLTCPKGFTRLSEIQAREDRLKSGAQAEAARTLLGRGGIDATKICLRDGLPEEFSDIQAANAQISSVRAAPYKTVPANAYANALAQAGKLPKTAGHWTPVGKGQLQGLADLGEYDVAGRPTDLDYVAKTDQVFASISYGGVWRSDDHGRTWRSIGEGLPTQVIGSVKYSSAGGGTLIALTGDGSFGADSLGGIGAFWTTNGGKTWHHAKGIPNDLFGFALAVDHSNPKIVYAATGGGLYRSTDAGRKWRNVLLPVGPCTGKLPSTQGCTLANMVTDVIVQEPGGSTHVKGGKVLAAVGWRAGAHQNQDGTVQSPANGLYASDTGAPRSFRMLHPLGFAPQSDIGRVEFGEAIGPTQNHNYVYAMVQSAKARVWNTYAPSLDVPINPIGIDTSLKVPTVFEALYVTSNFGQTWIPMTTGAELQEPQTGSSLVVVEQLLAKYGPGAQSWYDMFVEPDPTKTTPGIGAPSRIVFGLEEVWQNEGAGFVPQVAKSQFYVIGRYFSGTSCLALGQLVAGVPPVCPTDRGDVLQATSTTHPDQHTAVWIPEKNGGVTLLVGNDGGIFRQTLDSRGQLKQKNWGKGSNAGFRTLLPYHASIANDGTVWMGLQDNGTASIDPRTGVMAEKLGGDGFWTAVNPKNSQEAFGEYTYANMSSTNDGGTTWNDMTPAITDTHFGNPFVMDPRNANHLMTAGRQVVETTKGTGTTTADWKEVFNLGTMKHRGSVGAESDPATDPAYSMSALDLYGANAYVAFCTPSGATSGNPCDILDSPFAFQNGLATNVGGKQRPKTGSSQGWHFAKAKGLPNREVTGIAIDPNNPKHVYVTLGGYDRPWTNKGMGKQHGFGHGHVFESTDAGNSFRNLSANLPNSAVWDVALSKGRLLVATEVGVFIRSGSAWKRLGSGLPHVWVHALEFKPNDPNLLIAATYGRGVWAYRFGPGPSLNAGQPKALKGLPSAGVTVGGTYTFDTSAQGWTAASNSPTSAFRRQPPGDGSPFA
ncbi:MAG TPA: hypothetical protein VKA30_12645, partial [Actinomycetota bacterium]|nr:hypothetical protein [Actinomycetota bacterium]